MQSVQTTITRGRRLCRPEGGCGGESAVKRGPGVTFTCQGVARGKEGTVLLYTETNKNINLKSIFLYPIVSELPILTVLDVTLTITAYLKRLGFCELI